MDAGRVEAMIAREARRVLDNPERPPAPDLSLGLQSLLSLHRPVPAGAWFDGLVRPTIRIRPDHHLELRSLVVWGESGSIGKWVEVFGADLHPAEDRDLLHDYVLYFGRQDRPGRKVPVEQGAELLPALRQAGEWTWAQVFSKGRS